jgi:pyridoxine 5-phosphate synthase
MVKLSVNINKIATLRNARGGDIPSVEKVAVDCERFGAQGITIHPRPDERHIRYADVYALKPLVKTEFNIEGYPSADFLRIVKEVKPHQVTLVPDGPDVLTSNAGWDTKANLHMLQDIIAGLKAEGIRTSIFVDTLSVNMEYAAQTGTDRVELYTEAYAAYFTLHERRNLLNTWIALYFANQATQSNKIIGTKPGSIS